MFGAAAVTSPSRQQTHDLVVVSSYYVTPPRLSGAGDDPGPYVFIAKPHGDPDARPWEFRTPDFDLWNLAVEAEGRDDVVTVSWRSARRPDGKPCRIATDIESERTSR